MKVITEERLRELQSNSDELSELTGWLPEVRGFIEALIKECQELDTLTVTKLRPMSEIHDGDILVKWIQENGLIGAFYVDGWVYVNGSNYKPEEFQGWIPIPKYEPEKV